MSHGKEELKCVSYLIASDYADARTKCIRDVMNYYWTEEDGISNERTEAVEDAVDGLINLGYEPYQITGSLVYKSTDDSGMFVLRKDLTSPVQDVRRQEIINEYLPLDTRVERWSLDEANNSDNLVDDFLNLAEDFDKVAEKVYEETQDKDVLKIKLLTASTAQMAKKGELTEDQLSKSVEEVSHNLNLFTEMLEGRQTSDEGGCDPEVIFKEKYVLEIAVEPGIKELHGIREKIENILYDALQNDEIVDYSFKLQKQNN